MPSARFSRSKLFLLIAVACLMVLDSSNTWAQVIQPLEITAEPHYQLVLDNQYVRVFAVTLRPHEQTYVRHAYNFLMISPEDCEVVMWAEGQSAIQTVPLREGEVRFLFGGPARGLRNDSNQEFYVIVVEFLDPRVTTYGYHYYTGLWDYGGAIMPPPVDPYAAFVNTLPLGTADVKDVQLLPGGMFPLRQEPANELLIAITPVQLTIEGGESISCGMGEVLWLGFRDFGLLNSSVGPSRFIMVAIREYTQLRPDAFDVL